MAPPVQNVRKNSQRPVAIQVVSTGGFYGAERTLLELATYLRDHGWDSRIVALEGNGAGELMRRAAEHGISAEAFVPTGRLGLAAMLRRLKSMLSKVSRGVIHSHGYKPDILLAALGISRRLPCLATCHSWYSDTARLRLFESLDKWSVRRFDHVIAVSDEIYRDLQANGTPEARLSRIDNGITAPIIDPHAGARIRAELNLAAGEKLIVQIGRLAKSKQNVLLLKAVAHLPASISVRVAFVGSGEERDTIDEFARSVGLDGRVIFAGYRTDAAEILAAADVMAITSEKEGLPIVLLEAMAVGCPIIATSVGSIPSVLTPDAGWIVPSGNQAALIDALRQVLGSVSTAQERAAEANSIFIERHSRDVMGRRYLDIYQDAWRARGWG